VSVPKKFATTRSIAQWQHEYRRLVAECYKHPRRLKHADRSFLERLLEDLDNDSMLAGHQIERLELIWERVTAKG
jgi:hypothetical protein